VKGEDFVPEMREGSEDKKTRRTHQRRSGIRKKKRECREKI